MRKYNPNVFTENELYKLGYRYWDKKLMLIPYEKYNRIKIFTKLKCINGKTYIKGIHRIDDDVRYGMLAYGVAIPK